MNKFKRQKSLDFAKRPKAKVGKRAPAKVNATNTSFKTASVAVRSQAASLDKNKNVNKPSSDSTKAALAARMELQSSRGNMLSTLQLSLRHHASAVRCSAIKGIRDVVQSLSKDYLESKCPENMQINDLGVVLLEANLPGLLPNICRCWLDEDMEVRQLAIRLFGDILNNLAVSSRDSNNIDKAHHLRCLVPFVPFLCAYASSALNSLDKNIREDGASIIAMMASCLPNPSSSSLKENSDVHFPTMAIEVGKNVDLFLPPLVRLLSSISFGKSTGNIGGNHSGGNMKKRKRNASAKNKTAVLNNNCRGNMGSADSVLLSLALLLKASLADYKCNDSFDSQLRSMKPSSSVARQFTFLRNGRSTTNALMIFREIDNKIRNREYTNQRYSNTISKVSDLPSVPIECDAEKKSTSSIIPQKSNQRLLQLETNDTFNLEKIKIMTSLFETIRMKLVELMQTGCNSFLERNALLLPSSALETLDILVQTLRLAHRRCQKFHHHADQCQLEVVQKATSSKRQKKSTTNSNTDSQDISYYVAAYRTSIQKSLSLLLANFPLRCAGNKIAASRYELTNAAMCSVFAELGEKTMGSTWIDAVFSYSLPRFDRPNDECKDDSGGIIKLWGADDSEGGVTNMLLQAIKKLLLPVRSDPYDGTGYLLRNFSKRLELLNMFAEFFFPRSIRTSKPKDVIQGSNGLHDGMLSADGIELWLEQLALSSAGRSAAMLLTSLVSTSHYASFHESESSVVHEEGYHVLILQMTSVLPLYLRAWKDKFPFETGEVLVSMISIVRQWSTVWDESVTKSASSLYKKELNQLCIGLRHSMEILFATNQKNGQMQSISFFEMSSEYIQKLLVGLIGLLQCPSVNLVLSLAKICSRSLFCQFRRSNMREDTFISLTMASYIMEVMHSLRKTIPLSTFLAFLIRSSGIEKATLPKVTNNVSDETVIRKHVTDSIFLYDSSISRLSRFLIRACEEEPGSLLPVIRPTLEKWMSAPTEMKDYTNTTRTISADIVKQIIHARAAVSLVAAFTWDEVYSQCTMKSRINCSTSKFLTFDDCFNNLLLKSIFDLFELCEKLWPPGEAYSGDEVQQQLNARLLGPVSIIFLYRDTMLANFLRDISNKIFNLTYTTQGPSFDLMSSAETHMKIFLQILKVKKPDSISSLILSKNALQKSLLSTVGSIEKAVVDTHLMHLAEKLSREAEIITRLGTFSPHSSITTICDKENN